MSVPQLWEAYVSGFEQVLAVGVSANYSGIKILRIVGERTVAHLLSHLFRRTYAQRAEFFDANRVGDLISRPSSDTVIVWKSIAQYLSGGLRALVNGGAGVGIMASVSLKLTEVLAVMLPPVAIGGFFHGRAIRNLSRKIQRGLGTLAVVTEERLGNIRTSQALAGEILEVRQYMEARQEVFYFPYATYTICNCIRA
ncbi:MAG: ATP-binding cassette permease mdl1 [Geoglossum umbratile]|nr:MAG: ATP-binding cassette permease mdl1 [Geoglossum umbratile]